MTEYFMPIKPPTITQQMHRVTVRNGKPVFYEQQELKNARKLLTAALVKYRPDRETYSGAVELVVKWCFPSSGAHPDGSYRITKPDTDNLQKMLKDCMTQAGFWKDDAQVAREIVEKFWADTPGIYIRVSGLDAGG